MMRSMFAGVSGLRSHQTMMDVVGNNIANVNTVGFKSSRTLFQDTLSQLVRGAGGGDGDPTGGINPQQVGLGVRIGGIDMVFSQGTSQLTGRATDVAVQGEGFFVMRAGQESFYTRAGSFNIDQNGFLTDPSGAIVQGWLAGEDGTVSTNGPIKDLRLPMNQVLAPTATSMITFSGNLSASATVDDPPIVTSIEVVDALGAEHQISFEITKTGDNAWDLVAKDAEGNDLGTSSLTFDPASGELTAPTDPPAFTFTPPGGGEPVDFAADLAGLTQYGGASTSAVVSQDGTVAGSLRSFAISDDGTITGVFSNGGSRELGRLALATFTNPGGLEKAGSSLLRATSASGRALVGSAGTAGRGTLAAGTLEMSNVDLAQEFTNLIIAQRGFQANSRIITASDELLQDLVNLKR